MILHHPARDRWALHKASPVLPPLGDTMNQAQRYRISAAHAREHGDPYNADWLDEQADILEATEAEQDDGQQ